MNPQGELYSRKQFQSNVTFRNHYWMTISKFESSKIDERTLSNKNKKGHIFCKERINNTSSNMLSRIQKTIEGTQSY